MIEQLAYRVGNLLNKEQYLSDMESNRVDTCLDSCSESQNKFKRDRKKRAISKLSDGLRHSKRVDK